jgi:hypothetical protein
MCDPVISVSEARIPGFAAGIQAQPWRNVLMEMSLPQRVVCDDLAATACKAVERDPILGIIRKWRDAGRAGIALSI